MKKSLQEVLHENRLKSWEAEKKKIKARKKKEKTLNIVIGVLVVVGIIGLVTIYNHLSKEALNSCMEDGKSYNYCINHI